MHKFKFLVFILLGSLPMFSQAQNIRATYAIEKDIIVNKADGSHTITLSLTGHYYKQNERYIFWESPAYLSKYPNGEVSFFDGNSYTSYALNTDTIQNLFYHDYDSLIVKQGLFNQNQHAITEYSFEAGRAQPWKYEKETKIINGLKCQLATDRDQWRVWFCPDIPVKTSLQSLQGLPGLVVEAQCLPINEHITLINYDMPAHIDNAVFKPEIFRQQVIKGGLLKNIKLNTTKTKMEKQQELLKQ